MRRSILGLAAASLSAALSATQATAQVVTSGVPHVSPAILSEPWEVNSRSFADVFVDPNLANRTRLAVPGIGEIRAGDATASSGPVRVLAITLPVMFSGGTPERRPRQIRFSVNGGTGRVSVE